MMEAQTTGYYWLNTRFDMMENPEGTPICEDRGCAGRISVKPPRRGLSYMLLSLKDATQTGRKPVCFFECSPKR